MPNNLAHKPSENSLLSIKSSSLAATVATYIAPTQLHSPKAGGFFSRFIGSPSIPSPQLPTQTRDGPVEDLIVAGTSFG
jgi:hypothetical protein